MTDTLLPWFGGKTQLADRIVQMLPKHGHYVEPFFGMGAVFFRKPRSQIETINDLDGDVTNFFRVVRDHTAELAAAIHLTPYSRDEFAAVCESKERDDIERARCFAYRIVGNFRHANRATATDWVRTTKSLAGNSGRWASLPGKLGDAAERLRDVQIENRNAYDLLPELDTPHTLFYLDPPYYFQARRRKADTYGSEMSDGEHRRLMRLLTELQGTVVLSGYDSVMYNDRLAGWAKFEFDQALALTSVDGKKDRVTECLWINRGVPHASSLERWH